MLIKYAFLLCTCNLTPITVLHILSESRGSAVFQMKILITKSHYRLRSFPVTLQEVTPTQHQVVVNINFLWRMRGRFNQPDINSSLLGCHDVICGVSSVRKVAAVLRLVSHARHINVCGASLSIVGDADGLVPHGCC